ncbi:hypothetical protein BDV10DRAFT_163540 [Aspergillus recurvatus]
MPFRDSKVDLHSQVSNFTAELKRCQDSISSQYSVFYLRHQALQQYIHSGPWPVETPTTR